MIIIIIIFAKGINHMSGRGGDGTGGRRRVGGGAGLIVNMRVLAHKTHPYPSAPLHVSLLNIHMSTVSPSIYQGLSIRPVPAAPKQTDSTHVDRWRVFTWTTCQ